MSKSILVSKNHGVNPSMLHCPICGESTAIALLGKLPGDEKAPKAMRDKAPCESCEKDLESYKAKGFLILISSHELSEKEQETPWIFFEKLHVITFEAAERMFETEFLKVGAAWMSRDTASKIGLP
jgi:hypothetical protein